MLAAGSRIHRLLFLLFAAGLDAASLPAQQPAPPSSPPTGAIAGQVVDRATGRTLSDVRVTIVGLPGLSTTDLDGRFRRGQVPVGAWSVRAAMLGYRPQQLDSIVVRPGQTAVASFALSAAAFDLQDITVATTPATAASDAGLLAIQQAAPAASDGISAEALKRTPDSDAGDAIARVPGVTVVDNKFVVIRGLGERFTNTLINGVEMASPEPLKRVVPLDIFAAGLLESIVTTKAATPDKPGDFAGGSVEITTREFPDNFTAQVKLSQEINSASTFRHLSLAPRRGSDFFGFDDGSRAPPDFFPSSPDSPADAAEAEVIAERFGESLRNVWAPAPRRIGPNLGFGFNVGGQLSAAGAMPVGFVSSLSYSAGASSVRDRRFAAYGSFDSEVPLKDEVINEAQAAVDWGAIFNLSTRLGSSTKLGLKNFYTRNAEETFFSGFSFDQDESGGDAHIYQVRYIERDALQSQLSGEHLFGFLNNVRLDWKATYSAANRDEPENRELVYFRDPVTGAFRATPEGNKFQFRFLKDRSWTAQADLGIPFSFRGPGDALLQVGGLRRDRSRDFDGTRVNTRAIAGGTSFADTLAPELFYSPENIGQSFTFVNIGTFANSYESTDDLTALYALADFPLFPGMRLVGGVRMEDWQLDIYSPDAVNPQGGLTWRRQRDYLPSANLTIALSDRTNLRVAGFRTVARPDPRELTDEEYFGIGQECALRGDKRLNRSRIVNADAKLEFFPRSGEVMSLSAFYKSFDDPVINILSVSAGGCQVLFANAASARVYGGELEFRKNLGAVAASVNFSLVSSRARLDSVFSGALADTLHPPLQGQSPFVLNLGLSYEPAGGSLSGSVLYNLFGDRIARYGSSNASGTQIAIVPDQIEQGRGTLDAKIRKAFGSLAVSLAGRNLTNARILTTQETVNGHQPVGLHRTGRSIGLEVTRDF